MAEEIAAFIKYTGFCFAGKALSYYLIPSVILQLTYADNVLYKYPAVAFIGIWISNLVLQIIFSNRYRSNV